MHGDTALVVTYAIIWLALLGYLGWIALRVRGVREELATVRELVQEHEHAASSQEDRRDR